MNPNHNHKWYNLSSLHHFTSLNNPLYELKNNLAVSSLWGPRLCLLALFTSSLWEYIQYHLIMFHSTSIIRGRWCDQDRPDNGARRRGTPGTILPSSRVHLGHSGPHQPVCGESPSRTTPIKPPCHVVDYTSHSPHVLLLWTTTQGRTVLTHLGVKFLVGSPIGIRGRYRLLTLKNICGILFKVFFLNNTHFRDSWLMIYTRGGEPFCHQGPDHGFCNLFGGPHFF